MIIFLLLILTLLLTTHFFIAYTINKSFKLDKYKMTLYIITFVLAISFLAFSVLIHAIDNSITRFFYLLSSLWLGLLSNLFFGFLILSIIIGIFKLTKYKLNLKIGASIVIILSLILSSYSYINAKNIVTKEISLKIENIGKTWKNKKVIFISDVHIGAINRDKFLNKLITILNKQEADLILIGGDLFDGSDGKLEYVSELLNNINSKQGIYFVNGNHEVYLGLNEVREVINNSKVVELQNETIEIDQVQIVGVSYIESRMSDKTIEQELKNIKNYDRSKASILLYHEPKHIEQFKDYGFDLVLAGHTHKGQIWPYNFVTNKIYNGLDYGLHKIDNLNIYTSNGVGTWGPPMRIGNSPEIVIINFE